MPSSDTQWKPGQSGNPNGRPPGLSLTKIVEEELGKKVFQDEEEITRAKLLVEKILTKAINDGDNKMIELCWNYLDGKPTQTNEHYVKEMPAPILGGKSNAVHSDDSDS